MAGFFFQPRDVTGLNSDALLAYARHCEDTIRQNAIKLAELRGQMKVLGEGRSE